MPMLDKTLNTVIMPFRLKLKRTGRYILSYKNSFLIRIQLLDNSIMECTLTMESSGNDCLNAVAQKLELRETKYFGLYYMNKHTKARWVELDKPLKKQIDKNSQELTLYFGVMFYVANIDSLEQEITRYLFYLQLKNNVIDGLLHCTKEEAVDLASYILQAEFEDHDPTKHVLQFFSDYILFPEALTPNEETLASLTLQAIDLHKRHRGLRPADAEYNFILKAIHLTGFSEDLHPAKNLFGNDVTVGCSFVGIIIKSRMPDMRKMEPVCHDWQRVECISCTKQTFSLEVIRADSSALDANRAFYQFNMEDADTAKYLCRLCESQRRFYLQNKESTRKLPLEAARSLIRRPTLRRNPDMGSDEMEQPLVTVQAGSDFVAAQDNNQVFNADRYYSSQTSLDHAYVSQTSLNQPPPAAEPRYSNGFGGSVYSSPSINSLSQSHVGRPSPANSNLSINSVHLRGMNRGLPLYRPSPDYDVALRQRRRYSSYLESNNNPNVIRQSANQQQPSTSVPPPSLKPRPHSMIYSQQELVHQAAHGPPYAHYPQQHPPLYYRRSQPPLDSSQGHIASHIHWDTSHESLSPPGGSQVVDTRLIIPVEGKDLRSMTGSTPELTVQPQGQAGRPMFVSEMQLHRQFQNPPAESHGLGSTSTPDLSLQQNVSASSPDLYLGHNQPPRPHRPLPPVESYSEEGYNNQQMLIRLVNNQMPTTSEIRMRERKQKKQQRPISTSFDMLESRTVPHQTPQQNVQAYLEQVGHMHHNPAQEYQPYKRPLNGSRERLLQKDVYDHQQYSNQQAKKPPLQAGSNGSNHDRVPHHYDSYGNYQQQQNATSYHHAAAPSTATMVVHSDDEGGATADYLLSQQLQEQALEQVRITRSQEYLDGDHRPHGDATGLAAQQRTVTEYLKNANLKDQAGSQYRPPPPYPDQFIPPEVPQNNSIDETSKPQLQPTPEDSPPNPNRGPPPPYHTPLPSLVGQDIVETYVEDEDSDVIETRSDSFQHARRSTIRKMAPLKFAAMNGLDVGQRSNNHAKGEPDERVLNLEAKLDDGHVLTEYDDVTRTRLGDYDLESMSSRDRVKEVVPYADCRVMITPSSDNPSGYINASHIKAAVADEEWHYIASQTPLDGYQDEMWDMVWLNNASIIVLLTQEVENGKIRCAQYWPDSGGDQDIPCAVFGNYKVMCRCDSRAPTSGERCSRVTRNLVLERAGSSEKRTIWMLQYTSWPDTGVPKETDDFLGFMKELDSVRRLAVDNNESANPGPVVVQCASGCGRTGVLILTELMVQCLERNQDISVAEMLTHIRQQRIHFVQTFSQYNFVYKLLIAFLSKSRLI